MGGFIIGSNRVVLSPTGGGNTIIREEDSDFSPVNSGGVLYRIDSPTDVTVTINEDSCPIGQCIRFTQVGVGQILFTDGDIAFEIDDDTSLKSYKTGSTVEVFHAAVGIYNVYGQTE